MITTAQVIQAFLSALAGITVALLSNYITSHRENKKWLKEEVYRPLYDELVQVEKGNIPDDSLSWKPTWDTYSPYLRLQTDDRLTRMLDEYSSFAKELLGYEKRLHEESKMIVDKLPSDIGIIENDTPLFILDTDYEGEPIKSVVFPQWLRQFGAALLNSDATKEARQRLKVLASTKYLGYENFFQRCDASCTMWLAIIHKQIFQQPFTYEYLRRRHHDLPKKATSIREELEKRMAYSWHRLW